jgi:hypothetical protein
MTDAQCEVWKYRGEKLPGDSASDRPKDIPAIFCQSDGNFCSQSSHLLDVFAVGGQRAAFRFPSRRTLRKFCYLLASLLIRDDTAFRSRRLENSIPSRSDGVQQNCCPEYGVGCFSNEMRRCVQVGKTFKVVFSDKEFRNDREDFGRQRQSILRSIGQLQHLSLYRLRILATYAEFRWGRQILARHSSLSLRSVDSFSFSFLQLRHLFLW